MANKKLTLELNKHKGRKWRDEKDMGWWMVWNTWNVNGSHRKAEVAKFISYKIDFKSKTISRDREGHYIVIKADSTERYNNYKPPNIKKANIDRFEGKNWAVNNNKGLQYSQ